MISGGYITYIREVKNKDKILQIQIKILKKDIVKNFGPGSSYWKNLSLKKKYKSIITVITNLFVHK